MTIQQQIDTACAYAGISKAELSRRLGYSTPQAFQKRYNTGKFTRDELINIGKALNAEYYSVFRFADGKEI